MWKKNAGLLLAIKEVELKAPVSTHPAGCDGYYF